LAIGRGYDVDVVYLDYGKAFDTIWHSNSSLLTKLVGYGIDGQLLSEVESFLQGRRRRVVRGVHSDWVNVFRAHGFI